MMKKIKTGISTIKFDTILDKIAEETIKTVPPEIEKIVKKEMEKLEKRAKERWLVRSEKSQRSIDKFKIRM